MTNRDDSIGPEMDLDVQLDLDTTHYGLEGRDNPSDPPTSGPPPIRQILKTPTEPDPPITASEAIEIVTTMLAPVKAQVADMHAMMMGVKRRDGSIVGGIGKQTHDINNSALIVAEGANLIADAFAEQVVPPGERRKSLPELIAESVANKFMAMFQHEVRALMARIEKLEGEHHGLNGNGETPPDSR
jgi:hypothetical protein